jgi:DNA-binding MarR family transcriptional regulator
MTGPIRGDESVASSAEQFAKGAGAMPEVPRKAAPRKVTSAKGGPRSAAEPTLMYVMKQVELATRARLDELFRPIGMTALQYTALTVLERHPDLSSAQLARNSFVTTQSMADMVAALEERGLIERHRDAADRRRLVLALTEDGRALLRGYRGKVGALERRMLAGLTGEQVSELRHSLSVCRANLADNPPR